ncbi:MAG: DUF2723 domain-containing protein [Bacteroidia bacterium]|nr:DUF2723 domain-containing protein [Bacteroidia bacterium]
MKKYNLMNVVMGWLVFIIAMVTYTLTLEPTASFWDCGEFISASYRLQVVHPPGAPLFLIIGRLFSLMAGNDVTQVAFWVNIVSALASALTVLFSFWTITHLAKKILVKNNEEPTDWQAISIIGAGAVGALSLTFSDTFWFSAVEAEVYASSCFFTAITFWAILKWENVADEKHADRWLILIGYFCGLAIGVHLLNLLVIPAIVYVYYFRKYTATSIGIVKASLVAFGAIAIVQFGIIPGLPTLAAYFDLTFVNSFSLPFGSGIVFFGLLVTGLIVYGIIYSIKKNKVNLNTGLLVFSFVIIGYSSYAMIVIRSIANPPLDMNNPENPFTLISYLNREQYGDRPLLYGQYYTAKYIDTEEGSMQYRKGEEKYEEVGPKIEPVWEKDQMTIFPRMWSNRGDHVKAYRDWENIPEGKKPSFAKNIDFLFSYQLNFMYWRYFFWNFIGRQSDEQGHGELTAGNWESGVKFIDKARLGPQDNLPGELANNKGKNHYYFLPLILGLLGLVYQFNRAREDAFVITLLFLFTGVFIIIYLNFPPLQPRERDYAYVGSYQTFFIWVGLGVLAIADWLSKKTGKTAAAAGATVIGLFMSPYLLAKENWDDHDRSDRYTAIAFAKDYLNSCAKNAVLFTNGDNDTYPLWYAQNVEGYRTDIRVINLSLLNTDWYTDGLKVKTYDSEPVPISLKPEQYVQGIRDYVVFYENKELNIAPNVFFPLKQVIDFIANDKNPVTKVQSGNGETLSYYPTKNFYIPVDRQKVLANKTVHPNDAAMVVDSVNFTVNRNTLMKNDLITLDFIATSNWDRPVYFAITTGSEAYLNLEGYFQLEGLTYRLVPIRTEMSADREIGHINTDIMYDNLMNKFEWGNMDKPGIYLDETILRQTKNFRNLFYRLAKKLMEEGKKDKALAVLDRCMKVMPKENVPYDVFMIRIIEGYYMVGAKDKAAKLTMDLAKDFEQKYKYYNSFRGNKNFRKVQQNVGENYQLVGYCQQIASQYQDKATADAIQKILSGMQMPM